MKNLKRILSVILIASMIFTSNAMITLAENENQVVSSEETTAIANASTEDVGVSETTVGANEATVGANARGALDSRATASDAEDTAEENIEVDDDFIGPRLVEPEEDEITTANENADTENKETTATAENSDADTIAASTEAGVSETTKATTETTVAATETTAAETETTVESNETTIDASELSIVANTETAAETETTVEASESSVGANEETVGANARGALVDDIATASDAEEDDNAKTDEEIKIASASTAEIKTNDEETFGAPGSVYYALVGTSPNFTLYFSSSDITTDPKGTGATIQSHGLVNDYNLPSNRPWYSNRNNITTIEILDGISPSSTAYWFHECRNATSIIGLDKIDTSGVANMTGMFSNCRGLTTLDLSSFNTSNVTTMNGMFGYCLALTSLDLSSFNTSNVTDMHGMFNNCRGLTTLDLSSFNTSRVTDMGNMFYSSSGLTTINLSSFNTSNVSTMEWMFDSCPGLSTLDLSSFNTSSVTNMSFMFHNCDGLTTLDLSNFDTSSVTNMLGMFEASGLTTLDLSSFNTSNVTNMSRMFESCRELTSLDLSSFNTSNVTDMSTMFKDCRNLNIIKINSARFNTGSVTNSDNMFYDCTKLIGYEGTVYDSSHRDATYARLDDADNGNPGYFSEFPRILIYDGTTKIASASYLMSDIGNTVAEPVKPTRAGDTCVGWYKEQALTNAFNFASDTLPGNMRLYVKWGKEYTFGNDYKGVLYNAGVDFDTELINITFEKYPTAAPTSFVSERDIPNSNGLKLYILTNANDNTKNDVIIYAPADGVIKAPANCEQLFSTFHANKIESINNLTYLDTSDVTNMVNMFNGSECLTSLDLSGFNTSNVTTMERMFIGCGVSTLDLSSFDTSNVTTMELMFTSCERLTSVNLSSFNTSNVTSMAFMFSDCKELTSLDLSSFNTSSVTTMQHMFSDCRALTNLNISSFDTSNVTNMLGMFLSCQAITSLDLSHFNTSNVTNMDSFISGCEKLTSIDLSSFDTSNVTNIGYMFSFCVALTTLDLSSFNTSNAENMAGMFSGCPNLNLIKVDSSKFNTANVTDSDEMFMNCHKLIGYQETKFDTSHIDVSYAHIDAADNGNPGYFSEFPRIFVYDGTTRLARHDYTMANIGHTVAEPTKPTKTGLYFGGWYKEEALTNEFNFATDVLPGNMFLYVKWSTTPPKQVSTIEVKPNTIVKTTYDKGDPFDPTGLVLKVNYDDGTSEEIDYATHTGEISFNPTTISSSGNVVITYKGQTTTVAVRVNGDPTPTTKTIKSVDINRTPRRTTYTVGDYIDPTGIVLKVTYDDNTTETITYDRKTKNDFTFKPSLDTPLTTDDKEVVITYGKKTVRFSIVVDKKSDPTPSTGGNGGNSGGGSDPTKGPMGDLTKNPEYAKLLDPLANPLPTQPIDQTLNTTNNLPQEDLIYDTKLIDALKSFPENANPTKANVEDTDGNKGYGEWLNVPRTTTWYFLTGNLKPEDVAMMSTKESGGFLRSGWYNLGWKGENKWYHFNTGGVMDIGWYTENNLIYYLEADLQDNWYGKAVTGTKVIDGITYNFGTNGALIP